MNENVKYFEEINRAEWIRWNWIYVVEFGDSRPKYIRGAERDVSEAEQAGRNFDLSFMVRRVTKAEV